VSDGVIGRPACGWLEIWGAALQADGEARSTFGASSIRRRSTAWTHSAGLDVSVKETSVCIVNDTGRIVREVKVATELEALLAVLTSLSI
jgi:transposase